MIYKCTKCRDTGWYSYDHNHITVCDECCLHEKGWWLLEDHYGEDNGKWCCKAGCGHTVISPLPCLKEVNISQDE